ncbi:MAG: type IV toxin-antitoxin system AbiEi family antitoxin domain-containing protein [Lachnospiraceae bacterium]|nr:type IV toxin-antitoxin system AbiEi family antitoxin domain-containing protein [Lachnospiraceae bacterium]
MKYDLLYELSNKNGGILKTNDAIELNISKTYFLEFIRNNDYEKIAKGIYMSPDAWKDELYILQQRFPGIIYSHNVSLYLFDLTDREPEKFSATVRQGYNSTSPRESGLKIYTVKREWYEMGVTTASTIMGHEVRVYSPERTLCDILRPNSDVDLQNRQTALKEYVKRKNKDIPTLMNYAKILKVDKILKQYMEVLL